MIRWERLGSGRVPEGETLELFRRGEELSIRIGGAELMTSRAHGSEDALARLACAAIRGRRAPRVLVGGLGMGYTLRTALDALPPRAVVVVAELVPEVVAWNRGVLAPLAGRPLDDGRVSVAEADVGAVLAREVAGFDAVLLDVDNGPSAVIRAANAGLYTEAGLAALRRALRPDGVAAVWSVAPDARFTARLRWAGFAATLHRVRARGAAGGRPHAVWVARVLT